MTRAIIGAALLAAVLGGCASGSGGGVTSQEYEITPLPKNYKTRIIDYLKTKQKHRGQIRVGNAYQDSCRISENARYYGWAVPITYGTKKRGRKTVPQEIVWFNNNSIEMISTEENGNCFKA